MHIYTRTYDLMGRMERSWFINSMGTSEAPWSWSACTCLNNGQTWHSRVAEVVSKNVPPSQACPSST